MKYMKGVALVLALVLVICTFTEAQRNNRRRGNKKGNKNNSKNSPSSPSGSGSTPEPPVEGLAPCKTKECKSLRAELARLQEVLVAQQAALATAAPVTSPKPTTVRVTKPKTKKTTAAPPSTTPMPPVQEPVMVEPATGAEAPSTQELAPATAEAAPGPSQQKPEAPVAAGEPVASQIPVAEAPGAPGAPVAESASTKSLKDSLSAFIEVLETAPPVAPRAATSPVDQVGTAAGPPAAVAADIVQVDVQPAVSSTTIRTTTRRIRTTTTATTTTTTTPVPPTEPPTPIEPCPPAKDISPCLCTPAVPPAEFLPSMDCSPAANLGELAKMARKKVNGTLFKRIILQNTMFGNLPQAAFGPHKAEEYWITNNVRLARIDRGAFGPANPSSLVLNNNALTNIPWQDLRSFTNLRYFIAYENQLIAIPDRAFAGVSAKMVDILLHNNSIQNVGEFPFARLPSLNAVTLHNNLISEVQSSAFHFDASPNILTLQNNFIKSFETDTFGRAVPLYTNLANNVLEYMEREVWLPYLGNVAAAAARSPGKQVAVDMTGNPILCEKCDSFWLWQNKRRFENIVVGLTCIDAITTPNFFQLDRLFFRQCF